MITYPNAYQATFDPWKMSRLGYNYCKHNNESKMMVPIGSTWNNDKQQEKEICCLISTILPSLVHSLAAAGKLLVSLAIIEMTMTVAIGGVVRWRLAFKKPPGAIKVDNWIIMMQADWQLEELQQNSYRLPEIETTWGRWIEEILYINGVHRNKS